MAKGAENSERTSELLEGYRAELIAHAQSILGNREDAEEVVQETFCEALRSQKQLEQSQSVPAWLKSINRCNALDRLRSSRREKDREQLVAALEEAFTTGGFSRLELRDSLEKAIEKLPELQRQAVRLHYFKHLSYKEIATRLRIPLGSVSAMMMDASVRLFAQLSDTLKTEIPPINQGETQSHPPVSGGNP